MLTRALFAKLSRKPAATLGVFQFNQQREMHSWNKMSMEFIAKGWSALKEVDRVIDYCELSNRRLIPLLRTAKENFQLAMEADNTNTHARNWLSRLHLRYHVPGANKAVGAALLIEAAEMRDPDAQYELGCRLRVEEKHCASGVEVPESLTKFSVSRGSTARKAGKISESHAVDPVEMTREKFQIADKSRM